MRRRRFHILMSALLALGSSYGLISFLSRNTLIVDGKSHVRRSPARGSVRDLLDAFEVHVSSSDLVQPDVSAPLRWGQEVRVIRVREKTEILSKEGDFVLDWKRRTSLNLRLVEIQTGHRVRTTATVRRTFHDGKEFKSEEVKKTVRKLPTTRIVLFNRRNVPEKTYDLSQARKLTLVATAYWEGDPQVPGIYTYLDHRIERGIVAVDPAVVPLRSRLYIPGYGYAYASDTGSAIKGNRIDLVVPNKEASREWEHRKVTVYVLERAAHW